ncbi:uncharacterized protein LODBEIA_P58430 [Lodderomyces beijingensis]|uniref:Uncharacterized protein n=1 Tax=Lodderomyces beijingensis TaxID=1775926 RepID=A0ABP0ZTZ9_9ASCO
MHFVQALSLLAIAAQSLAELTQIRLYARSEDPQLDGKGLSPVQEGSGINYFFTTSNQARQLTYDDEQHIIYLQVLRQLRYQFSRDSDIVQLSVLPPEYVEIDAEGLLQFNGSDNLWASKNSYYDPNGYANGSHVILVGEPKDGVPIEIVAKTVELPTE